MPEKLTQDIVKSWFEETDGNWVSRREMDEELEIVSPKGMTTRRVILSRLLRSGFIEEHPGKPSFYRLTNNETPVIEWQTADVGNLVNMHWPFGIHNWVSLYPKNLAIIAGAPNAGKTALAFNIIKLNQHRVELQPWLPIQYYTSELGEEEMKLRLGKFGTSDWAFDAKECSEDTNWFNVMRKFPDRIHIIDYLEITDKYWLVARKINQIWAGLNKGIAIVMLQKNPSTKEIKINLGRGGGPSLEKPRLYISMDEHELTIVKGKNWAKEGQNPNWKKWHFNLVDGYKFVARETLGG